MSIQSTVNQGISLVSLLVAQSPAAQEKKKNEAEQLSRASARGSATGRQEVKKQVEAQELENTRRLFDEHSALVQTYGHNIRTDETIQRHIDTREAAMKHGKKLQDAEPDDARADLLAKWKTEIDWLKGRRKELINAGVEARKKQKNKPQEDAAISAAAALEVEQDRIAASNAITRSLDISNIDERALPRLERAYNRAVRDTKYLSKGNTED